MHTSVAIGILKNEEEKILLVKRERGNFPGLWALPGGKLEEGEGVYEAVVREVKEETALKTQILGYLGTAAEIISEENSISSTMLFFCELKTVGASLVSEQDYRWFSMAELAECKEVVFSDLLFLKHFYLDRDLLYMKLDCIHKQDGSYVWKEV